MPTLDTTFLNNTTREHFLPTLKNQLYNTTALMNRLFAKGRVKSMTGRSFTRREGGSLRTRAQSTCRPAQKGRLRMPPSLRSVTPP